MIDLNQYLRFRPGYEKALTPDFYPIEYLDEKAVSGDAVEFSTDNSAILVEIRVYPGGARVAHGLVATGDLDEIRVLIGMAEQWGRDNGCTRAMIESREGWQKALKSQGYAPWQVTLVKDL